MNTVSEKLLSGIVYATSAYTVWEDLKEQFDKVKRIRIYQLHKDINILSQDTDLPKSSVYVEASKAIAKDDDYKDKRETYHKETQIFNVVWSTDLRLQKEMSNLRFSPYSKLSSPHGYIVNATKLKGINLYL